MKRCSIMYKTVKAYYKIIQKKGTGVLVLSQKINVMLLKLLGKGSNKYLCKEKQKSLKVKNKEMVGKR